jgi:hypothetical protein
MFSFYFSVGLPLPQGCHSFVLNLFRYRALVERFLRNGSSVALYLAQGLMTKHCRYLVRGELVIRVRRYRVPYCLILRFRQISRDADPEPCMLAVLAESDFAGAWSC